MKGVGGLEPRIVPLPGDIPWYTITREVCWLQWPVLHSSVVMVCISNSLDYCVYIGHSGVVARVVPPVETFKGNAKTVQSHVLHAFSCGVYSISTPIVVVHDTQVMTHATIEVLTSVFV